MELTQDASLMTSAWICLQTKSTLPGVWEKNIWERLVQIARTLGRHTCGASWGHCPPGLSTQGGKIKGGNLRLSANMWGYWVSWPKRMLAVKESCASGLVLIHKTLLAGWTGVSGGFIISHRCNWRMDAVHRLTGFSAPRGTWLCLRRVKNGRNWRINR
jgi:hypothetical protein